LNKYIQKFELMYTKVKIFVYYFTYEGIVFLYILKISNLRSLGVIKALKLNVIYPFSVHQFLSLLFKRALGFHLQVDYSLEDTNGSYYIQLQRDLF
jgi:hypothetical protein